MNNRSEYQRRYCQEHRKEKKEYNHKYYQKYKEQAREYDRRYYQEHKEQKREYFRKYHQEHKKERREYVRKHILHSSKGKCWSRLEKRAWPGFCEICGKPKDRLVYHHWDNNNPSKGIWVCWHCHFIVEVIEKGRVATKYRRLKKQIEAQYDEGRTLESERQEATQGTLFQGS